MFAVSKVHIDKCVGFGCYSLMNGRLLHFWSDSAFGSLDFFVAYLDPADSNEQIRALGILRKHIRKGAHTLLAGDWNFVCIELDRVKSNLESGELYNKKQASEWAKLFPEFAEFEQPL